MVTVKTKTGHVNVSPTMFHLYAKQYYRCKQTFQAQEPFSPVPYFLLCRAIELEIKAKHLETKSRSEVKKEYGHNLKVSYDDLEPSVKVLNEVEYDELAKASIIYDVPYKGFEYCTVHDAGIGYSNFPDLDLLDQITKKLINI
jgi:hypothetical protein